MIKSPYTTEVSLIRFPYGIREAITAAKKVYLHLCPTATFTAEFEKMEDTAQWNLLSDVLSVELKRAIEKNERVKTA